MLKPADGMEGAVNAIVSAVQDAGPNACPPVVVGVGIGGTFVKSSSHGEAGVDKTCRNTF